MNDITVRYIGNGKFMCSNSYDIRQCEVNLKHDDIYSIQPKKKRNLKRHNLYWLWMTGLSYHTGFTAKQLHRFTCDEILMGKLIEKNGLKIRLSPSEAFDNMDSETEAKEYIEAALFYWSGKGYNLEECLKEYKSQINMEGTHES